MKDDVPRKIASDILAHRTTDDSRFRIPHSTFRIMLMTRSAWIFAIVALGAALLLALFASPFASTFPDGLERVAADHGFLKVAEDREPVWTRSPMPDYAVKGVASESASTGLAGLAGVLAVFAVMTGIGAIIVRRNRAADGSKRVPVRAAHGSQRVSED